MGKFEVLLTFLAALLLLTMPNVNGQLMGPQRPLCVSQLALVNYACGNLHSDEPAASLPSTVVFPDDDSHGHRHGHGHGHRHRHRHGHGHGHPGSPEDNCCRWINDLDDQCVCDLLAHLPPFLARPPHEYTIVVGDSCRVTYTCGFK